jgi:hypothetical protein
MKSLLHLNFVWKQFLIVSSYLVCWYFEVELLRKTFYRFSGSLYQWLLKAFDYLWCSGRILLTSNTLLIVSHAPSHLNIYCRPAWCILILILLNYGVASSLVKCWSLLLHEIATRGSTFSQDYWMANVQLKDEHFF